MPKISFSPNSRRIQIGERTIMTHGLARAWWQDIYHFAMTVSWPVFFLTIAVIFFGFNLLFATLYRCEADAIANLLPNNFLGAFFFSVETLATVGYGDMHPQTIYAHAVATVEIFVGMMSIALITGVMFARFSKPRARIMFAAHPVITQIDGVWCLMIRTANARQNMIVDASAKLRVLRNEVTQEGMRIRRVYDLVLKRDQHPIFLLGWNLIHPIDAQSPLHGCTAESLAQTNATFILTLQGIDETTHQSMLSRHMYDHSALRWNHNYVDMLSTDGDGQDHMDYTHFHAVRPNE